MKKYIYLLLLHIVFAIHILHAQEKVTAIESAGSTNIEFTKVEEEATFPGGNAAWRKFLEKNLNGSVPSDNDAPAGLYKVIIRFIIDKDGSTSGINAETKEGFGMEQEAIRVIQASGKWVPAVQNGRPIKAYRRQPISYIIENENFEITTEKPFTLFANTDNIISIKIDNKINNNIEITCKNATITALGNGKYKVNTTAVGRIVMYVNNIKKDKNIGAASFIIEQKK
jgi:Gram-negative bacterial TonB protein C-terminal